MKKTTLSLLAAGAMAAAGLAQAQSTHTFDVPLRAGEASTMTMGQPNLVTSNSAWSDSTVIVDTTVLGAAPATVVMVPPYAYVPQIPESVRHQAAATFNVPSRAGEVSTMTGGAPNMVTDNYSLVEGGYSAPVHRGPVVVYQ